MKETDLPEIIAGLRAIEKATGGPMGEWVYRLEAANTIWQRCPFAVGQRVELSVTPVINNREAWGWLGAKHFLVEGAVATVVERQFYEGHFRFGLHFDDESWIHFETKEKHRPDQPSMYMFWEKDLRARVGDR